MEGHHNSGKLEKLCSLYIIIWRNYIPTVWEEAEKDELVVQTEETVQMAGDCFPQLPNSNCFAVANVLDCARRTGKVRSADTEKLERVYIIDFSIIKQLGLVFGMVPPRTPAKSMLRSLHCLIGMKRRHKHFVCAFSSHKD